METLYDPSQVNRPDCPDHGQQVRGLLLGELGGDEARRVETASRDCDSCRGWWDTVERSEEFRQVEQGVRAGVASFTMPARRSRSWVSEIAIAASIVALAVLIPMVGSRQSSTVEPTDLAVSSSTTVQAGDALGQAVPAELISSDGFENGGATTWRIASD